MRRKLENKNTRQPCMKKIIFLTCFVFLFLFTCFVKAESSEYNPKTNLYYIKGGEAYYRDYKLENADPETFESLDIYWAKDKNQVYNKWNIAPGVDAETFEAINYEYGKDKNNAYWSSEFFNETHVIKNFDPKTFEPIYGHYAKDENRVYYVTTETKDNQEIKGADFDSFSVLAYEYSKDGNYVYYKNGIVVGADSETFKIIKGRAVDYGLDKNNVYCAGVLLKNSDSNTFEVIDSYSAKDKNNVYSGCNVNNSDSNTYEVLTRNYQRDKDNIYFSQRIIAGADSSSFEVIQDIYGKDKNYVYYITDIINGADSKTFAYINHGYGKDVNNVFYQKDMVAGADIQTFETLRDNYAKDKNRTYFKNKPIEENQARDFIIINNKSMYNRLKGKIVLKVEDGGKAYYVSPKSEIMHYLGKPKDAFAVLREQGIGITNLDLKKIPVGFNNLSGQDSDGDGLSDMFEDAIAANKNNPDTDGDGYGDKDELIFGYNLNGFGRPNYNKTFANSVSGKIFLQVESRGEAWYLNPNDNKRYFLGRPTNAFNIMRNFGLGISNEDIRKIEAGGVE